MLIKNHSAKKKNEARKLQHSQNFITEPSLIAELLEISEIGSEDTVLDIGAGKGIITKELIKQTRRVIAVEQDQRFAERLAELNVNDKLTVIVEDFRNVELPPEPFKVFSNIPFDITTEILSKLISEVSGATQIYLIMQEESAKRFAGMPHHKNSQNSILLATEFSVEILRKISRDFFNPKPNVGIVFAKFTRLQKPLISLQDRNDFREFVIYGYNQWAATVLEAFKKIFSHKQILMIKKSQKIQNLKPSDLSVEHWIALFRTFQQYVSEEKKAIVRGSENKLKAEQKKLKKWNRSRMF